MPTCATILDIFERPERLSIFISTQVSMINGMAVEKEEGNLQEKHRKPSETLGKNMYPWRICGTFFESLLFFEKNAQLYLHPEADCRSQMIIIHLSRRHILRWLQQCYGLGTQDL